MATTGAAVDERRNEAREDRRASAETTGKEERGTRRGSGGPSEKKADDGEEEEEEGSWPSTAPPVGTSECTLYRSFLVRVHGITACMALFHRPPFCNAVHLSSYHGATGPVH
ncbi:hypothetical protein Dda_0886 [Drechslerella dactyloides]|uniref:Uncharacterized protein n=1 Tax=Drechslerella dactyloides TaxID=74499 RepID=A0AAD6J8B7_DREDA|nr:hypothetical protein Dda_0886 [Drechslerella dactyloides]